MCVVGMCSHTVYEHRVRENRGQRRDGSQGRVFDCMPPHTTPPAMAYFKSQQYYIHNKPKLMQWGRWKPSSGAPPTLIEPLKKKKKNQEITMSPSGSSRMTKKKQQKKKQVFAVL